MSKLFKFFKKFIIAAFFVYGYNVLAQPLNLIIPLNLITITYVTVFGVSGLISLIIIYIFAFWGVILC